MEIQANTQYQTQTQSFFLSYLKKTPREGGITSYFLILGKEHEFIANNLKM